MITRALIVGARGPGSRLLWALLRTHPGVEVDSYADSDVLAVAPASWRPTVVDPGSRLRVDVVADGLLLPGAPIRARAWLGDRLGLVAVLDDPAKRAVDQHRRSTRLGLETLPLAEALAAEPTRLAAGLDDPTLAWASPAEPVRWASYAAGGDYAAGLVRWQTAFGVDALLILPTDELVEDPGTALHRVCDHLHLSPIPAPAWAGPS